MAGAVIDLILKPNNEIKTAWEIVIAHATYENKAIWFPPGIGHREITRAQNLIGTVYAQDIQSMLASLKMLLAKKFSFDRQKMFDVLWRETERDIRQHWRAIERAAILLDERKHLSGEEFEACILEGGQ